MNISEADKANTTPLSFFSLQIFFFFFGDTEVIIYFNSKTTVPATWGTGEEDAHKIISGGIPLMLAA